MKASDATIRSCISLFIVFSLDALVSVELKFEILHVIVKLQVFPLFSVSLIFMYSI